MSVAPARLLTADEFLRIRGLEGRLELVRGEVKEIMPTGGTHGDVAAELICHLRLWAKTAGGRAGVEAGFLLARDPDTVRSPDVYYVAPERVPSTGVPDGYWPFAPDLAVEVVSPNDTAAEVRAKVGEYLDAGTRLVWVVYPATREVIAHTPDGRAFTLREGDVLEAPDVAPGFQLRVGDLFV